MSFGTPCFTPNWPDSLLWCIRAVLETGIPVSAPWRPKTLSRISCVSTKKYFEVAINDFTMQLIILKWLRRKKYTQDKNNETKRVLSERRKCLRLRFYPFKCVIDHANVRFFFFINSLHCFVWTPLYYLLHLFSSDCFTAFPKCIAMPRSPRTSKLKLFNT